MQKLVIPILRFGSGTKLEWQWVKWTNGFHHHKGTSSHFDLAKLSLWGFDQILTRASVTLAGNLTDTDSFSEERIAGFPPSFTCSTSTSFYLFKYTPPSRPTSSLYTPLFSSPSFFVCVCVCVGPCLQPVIRIHGSHVYPVVYFGTPKRRSPHFLRMTWLDWLIALTTSACTVTT